MVEKQQVLLVSSQRLAFAVVNLLRVVDLLACRPLGDVEMRWEEVREGIRVCGL